MSPYVRESPAGIRAEQHGGRAGHLSRGAAPAGRVRPRTSVGVGFYRIDLHPSTGGDPYIDIAAAPSEIPLGALLPVRLDNLLPAAKNIGTTHITNGAYRMPSVEWNIGEVTGHLVAVCERRGAIPLRFAPPRPAR